MSGCKLHEWLRIKRVDEGHTKSGAKNAATDAVYLIHIRLQQETIRHEGSKVAPVCAAALLPVKMNLTIKTMPPAVYCIDHPNCATTRVI